MIDVSNIDLLKKLKNTDYREQLEYKISINNEGLIVYDSNIDEDIMDILHPLIEDNIISYDSSEDEEIDWGSIWYEIDNN